jgi:transforming growth factor-beta-induced protein
MRRSIIGLVAVLAVTFGASSATAGAQDTSSQTIVQIAQANPDFSTLVSAVSAAGLVETLSGPGPFTVFAPTNAAFAALPAGTLDALLADPTGDLTAILKLHVVSGAVDAAAATAAAGGTVETLGGPVAVTESGGKLMIGGATIVTTDIKASNGIIHVIDAVITEPASADEAEMPSGVDSGTDGLAAGTGTGPTTWLVLGLLGGVAALGIGTSGVAIVRDRRRS